MSSKSKIQVARKKNNKKIANPFVEMKPSFLAPPLSDFFNSPNIASEEEGEIEMHPGFPIADYIPFKRPTFNEMFSLRVLSNPDLLMLYLNNVDKAFSTYIGYEDRSSCTTRFSTKYEKKSGIKMQFRINSKQYQELLETEEVYKSNLMFHYENIRRYCPDFSNLEFVSALKTHRAFGCTVAATLTSTPTWKKTNIFKRGSESSSHYQIDYRQFLEEFSTKRIAISAELVPGYIWIKDLKWGFSFTVDHMCVNHSLECDDEDDQQDADRVKELEREEAAFLSLSKC